MKLCTEINEQLDISEKKSISLLRKSGGKFYYSDPSDNVLIAKTKPASYSEKDIEKAVGEKVNMPFVGSKSFLTIDSVKDGIVDLVQNQHGMKITVPEFNILASIDTVIKANKGDDLVKKSQDELEDAIKNGASDILFSKKLWKL